MPLLPTTRMTADEEQSCGMMEATKCNVLLHQHQLQPQVSAGLQVPQTGKPSSRSGSLSAGCTVVWSSTRSLKLWAKAMTDLALQAQDETC